MSFRYGVCSITGGCTLVNIYFITTVSYIAYAILRVGAVRRLVLGDLQGELGRMKAALSLASAFTLSPGSLCHTMDESATSGCLLHAGGSKLRSKPSRSCRSLRKRHPCLPCTCSMSDQPAPETGMDMRLLATTKAFPSRHHSSMPGGILQPLRLAFVILTFVQLHAFLLFYTLAFTEARHL